MKYILAKNCSQYSKPRRKAQYAAIYGKTVLWQLPAPEPGARTARIPDTPRLIGEAFGTIPVSKSIAAGDVIAELIPRQLLNVAIGFQTGVEPGVFRRIGKAPRME